MRSRNPTGANRGNGGQDQNLRSLRSLLLESGFGGRSFLTARAANITAARKPNRKTLSAVVYKRGFSAESFLQSARKKCMEAPQDDTRPARRHPLLHSAIWGGAVGAAFTLLVLGWDRVAPAMWGPFGLLYVTGAFPGLVSALVGFAPSGILTGMLFEIVVNACVGAMLVAGIRLFGKSSAIHYENGQYSLESGTTRTGCNPASLRHRPSHAGLIRRVELSATNCAPFADCWGASLDDPFPTYSAAFRKPAHKLRSPPPNTETTESCRSLLA